MEGGGDAIVTKCLGFVVREFDQPVWYRNFHGYQMSTVTIGLESLPNVSYQKSTVTNCDPVEDFVP